MSNLERWKAKPSAAADADGGGAALVGLRPPALAPKYSYPLREGNGSGMERLSAVVEPTAGNRPYSGSA